MDASLTIRCSTLVGGTSGDGRVAAWIPTQGAVTSCWQEDSARFILVAGVIGDVESCLVI
ncbi:hypothetical protein AWC27_08130 [Mycobacterium szulgai]|uniref:Uncharacterized protein n=1 Tax=Mycobacterium szulgai TaxID=1787 RepID=A0A1X2DY77_MYCSZ|nr:hypothetical protein AWC27_08130 [Mycobacterium szulgai]